MSDRKKDIQKEDEVKKTSDARKTKKTSASAQESIFSMKGVSGKDISASVVVIKKVRPKKEEPAKTEESTEAKTAETKKVDKAESVAAKEKTAEPVSKEKSTESPAAKKATKTAKESKTETTAKPDAKKETAVKADESKPAAKLKTKAEVPEEKSSPKTVAKETKADEKGIAKTVPGKIKDDGKTKPAKTQATKEKPSKDTVPAEDIIPVKQTRQAKHEKAKPEPQRRTKSHGRVRREASYGGPGRSRGATTDASTYGGPGGGRGQGRYKKGRRAPVKKQEPLIIPLTNVVLPESMTVKQLAETLKKTAAEVIKKLMAMGFMATLNQEIDFDTAAIISEEFGISAEKEVVVTEEDILFDDSDDKPEDLVERPPVVVVMGHVDHGKTSLLDKIRSASVVRGEAGGITQHIGAYSVDIDGKKISFLDTPGHEAFTTMRARGAQVTDIAILVVAADDGVMPQTIEAINHAKAAGVRVIVAINKIDKPGVNPDRIKQELTDHGIIPEEWGGDNIMVPVSALTGENIDELLEMVLLTAEVMELKANPDRQAKGTVIEAKLDRNRGPVATVLVQRGTLKAGDSIVTGTIVGRIRTMLDDKGKTAKEAGPSIPVEITGMPEVPEAGEIFYAVENERVARSLAERRRVDEREQQLSASAKMSLDTLFAQMESGVVKDLNIIVKADVQGSVEAVTQSLQKLSSDEVRINIIHGAVGTINESDLRLAEVSNAIVIGFNVRPPANVSEMAKEVGIDVRLYRVIYEAIEEIESAMKGMLDKKFEEVVLGHVEIRQIFKVSGIGTIGGAYVTDGKITRNSQVRLLREGIIIHEGKLASLKRFKDDVREVATGYECGISIEKYNDIKEGDIIEAFEMREIAHD